MVCREHDRGSYQPDVEGGMMVPVGDVMSMKEGWTLVIPTGQCTVDGDVPDYPVLDASVSLLL